MASPATVPHVSELAAEKAAEERQKRLGRRPPTPIPNSLAELHAYVTTDAVVELRAWLEAAYPLTVDQSEHATPDRYHPIPIEQRKALNLLESLHEQIHFPSQYAHDRKDIELAVPRFKAEGSPLWAWCYLTAYYDYLQRQKRLGNATRGEMRAVLDQIKELDTYALREAQDGLRAFH